MFFVGQSNRVGCAAANEASHQNIHRQSPLFPVSLFLFFFYYCHRLWYSARCLRPTTTTSQKNKKELPKKVLQVSRRGPSKRKKQNWKGLKGCDECDKQRALRVPARKWCGAKEKSNPKESTSRRLRPASASRLVVGSETKMKGKKKRTETRVPIWAELKLGKTRNERSSIWISIMKYVDFMD